jgi:hypothetical protein
VKPVSSAAKTESADPKASTTAPTKSDAAEKTVDGEHKQGAATLVEKERLSASAPKAK